MELSLDQVASFPVVFALCATSGILLPLPEDVPVLVAGIAASTGEVAVAPAIAGALSGVLVRDLIFFAAGRMLGEAAFRQRLVVRFIGAERLVTAREFVSRRGPRAVFAGRFFIGVRAPVFFMAGVLGLSLRDFVLWDSLGLVLMVPAMFGLGYAFGEPALGVLTWIAAHAWVVALALGLALAAWGVRTVSRGRRAVP